MSDETANRFAIRYLDGDRFRVSIRGHTLEVDQPHDDGGTDAGPTPTELFVAGLGSCVGFYAERFLHRHGLPAAGLRVEGRFAFAEDRPARVGSITMVVCVPHLPASKRAAFTAVIDHCTVHNSIRTTPRVRIEVEASELAA